MSGTATTKNDLVLPETYGLVVCGGNSSRMGTDKSMLTYYHKPQRYHVYDMLLPFCEKVFISCSEQQANNMEAGYPFITDNEQYRNIGPVAALLSACTTYPLKNILLIGCDYPFLNADDLQLFLNTCTTENRAVAFYNEQEAMYEPLLAWYPYRLFDELKKMYALKQYALQHFLKDTLATKFYPVHTKSIISIDTREDFITACNNIKASPL